MDNLNKAIREHSLSIKRKNEQTIEKWLISGMEGQLVEYSGDGIVVVEPCLPEYYGEMVIHVRQGRSDGSESDRLGPKPPWET